MLDMRGRRRSYWRRNKLYVEERRKREEGWEEIFISIPKVK
jgi:hypothetical protein